MVADACSILSSLSACARVPIPILARLYGCTAIPSDNLKSMPRPESATQGDKRSTGALWDTGTYGPWARKTETDGVSPTGVLSTYPYCLPGLPIFLYMYVVYYTEMRLTYMYLWDAANH